MERPAATNIPVPTAPTYAPGSLGAVGGRFISRGRLGARALYWIGWIAFSRRSVVTAGVEGEVAAIGLGGLRLVASASVLVGLIATFQVSYQLAPYGAETLTTRVLAWFAARELGPIVVAILVVARSAASIAGELASMSATGEIDALRAMGLDPVKYLVAPKVLAVLIVLPALTVIADAMIPLGGWIGSTVFLGYSTNQFVEQFRESFLPRDLSVGIAKAVLFALVIAIISADEGLNAERKPHAIGAAATRAVVFCLIGVLAMDTMVNAIFYFIPSIL
jgi:phospholipid/cholesterol/gamma-HCH transport system permease protein